MMNGIFEFSVKVTVKENVPESVRVEGMPANLILSLGIIEMMRYVLIKRALSESKGEDSTILRAFGPLPPLKV